MLTSLTLCFLWVPIGSTRKKLVMLLSVRCCFTANLNVSFSVMTSASLSQNENLTIRVIPFYHLVWSRLVSVAASLDAEIALKCNCDSYFPAPSPCSTTLHQKKGLFETAIDSYSCVVFQYTALSVTPCGKKYHFFLFTFLPIDFLDY